MLKDASLPSVWEEYRGLSQLEPDNRLQRNWKGRRQVFRWVNGIEYEYGDGRRLDLGRGSEPAGYGKTPGAGICVPGAAPDRTVPAQRGVSGSCSSLARVEK